jgi:uncharacterized protein YkwD
MAGFTTAQLSAFRTRARDLHNALRKERNGKTMLALDSRLNTTALKAAEYQASRNAMQHTPFYCRAYCSGCPSSGCTNACSCSKAIGENVAGGQTSVDFVVLSLGQGWRGSCQHYYNMVNGGFNLMGLGVAKSSTGKWFWAVHFAGRATICPGGGYCCRCVGGSCKTWASNDCWRPGGSCGNLKMA